MAAACAVMAWVITMPSSHRRLHLRTRHSSYLDSVDDLPPDVLQQEIIEHLEAALSAFKDVAAALPKSA